MVSTEDHPYTFGEYQIYTDLIPDTFVISSCTYTLMLPVDVENFLGFLAFLCVIDSHLQEAMDSSTAGYYGDILWPDILARNEIAKSIIARVLTASEENPYQCGEYSLYAVCDENSSIIHVDIGK